MHLHTHTQNVMAHINDMWGHLKQAELSILVNIFHRPEALFPPKVKAYHQVRDRFIKRYIRGIRVYSILMAGNFDKVFKFGNSQISPESTYSCNIILSLFLCM